jgi:DNA-binding transcriptional MerR regulator
MQIGIVAKKIGLSVDAIRFYERNALAFIRRVQGLGFKLSEIRGLLNLRRRRVQPCAPVRRRLEEKLSDIQRKLADLQKLQRELRMALRSCNKELRKRPAHCPILRERSPREPEKGE